MATAQDRFAAMLRDEIAPTLRAMGFRGSGRRFTLPSETHWCLLGFQKSQWSSADSVSFTINLVVVSRAAWAKLAQIYPVLGDRPGFPKLAPVFDVVPESDYWNERIGSVMPGGRDTWWICAADQESELPAKAVIEAIRAYAVPAMLDRMAVTLVPGLK